jgi:predicted RNA-binding Zn-ribbon protein involved in translation (DUF1610 family)
MDNLERNEHQTPCPRCGAEAEWSYVDPERTLVEIMCSDCGRYEMTRDEFDEAMEDAEAGESTT